MSDFNDSNRGREASMLLDSEVLKEALAAIEGAVIEQWEACPARDAEGKEALWQLYKTSKKFRGLLLGYVETGKLAADRIRLQKEHGLIGRVLRR